MQGWDSAGSGRRPAGGGGGGGGGGGMDQEIRQAERVGVA